MSETSSATNSTVGLPRLSRWRRVGGGVGVGTLTIGLVVVLVGCSPLAALPLEDGPYTCGPVAGSDLNHMTVVTDASGDRVDIFAMVENGEVVTLDLGRYGEVSDSIDSFVKQSNNRFNARIVNEKGVSGKFFSTGDPLNDAGWGNMLLCVHDG